MNEQAREIDLAFYNTFEELQGKGQRYEYLQAFASRASQLARRLQLYSLISRDYSGLMPVP